MFKKKTVCSMKEIKSFIINEATEENMVELIKLMQVRKSNLEIEKIINEQNKVVNKIRNL